MATPSRFSFPVKAFRIARGLSACAALYLATALPIHAASVVDPTSLDGKVLFGYQAWFDCPGTWGGSWSHWGGGPPSASNVAVEMYPDLSEFPKTDLCVAPALTVGGQPSYFFSARNPKIVDAHFRWMQEYGLDGVLIQRFVGDIPGLKRNNDVVLKNIIAASAKYGRVIAIEYDVTGSSFTTWATDIQNDWKYLNDQLHITAQPNYLHHKGKPLVSVWGIGLNETRNPPTNAADALALVNWFHTGAAAAYQASFMGGLAKGFRTLNADARTDPAWLTAYKAMDAVQPWNVGRYSAVSQIPTTFKTTAVADEKWAADAGVLYMSTLFPGYSQSNAIRGQKKANEIPRMGGNFIWQQAIAAKSAGAGAMKIAMFDEVNEATAMFKVVSKRSDAPTQGYWLALDGDGVTNLPTDWYLRLASEITSLSHGTLAPTDAIPIKPGDPFSLAVRGGQEASAGGLRWKALPDGIRFRMEGFTGTMIVSDLAGKEIGAAKFDNGAATWDYRTRGGAAAPAGVYVARARSEAGTLSASAVFTTAPQ